MRVPSQTVKRFQKMIFVWWKNNKRDLPWRHTSDPYKILVSEIMLQQTQVSRGLPKYLEFVKRFPTVSSLATASTGEILRLWKGMGYNRRALYIQKTAQKIVADFYGVFPQNEQQLKTLPGLGTYTARAVLVFAYKKDIAMVDTNIRQIITHFFFQDVPQSEKVIQEVADQLVPKGKSWEWHQALMDYGAIKLERNEKRTTKKKSKPFKETNRYLRGRLLDLVCERQWKELDLVECMTENFRKEKKPIEEIISGMIKDGLIIRNKAGIISLPE